MEPIGLLTNKRRADEMERSDAESIKRGSNHRKAAKVEARKIHPGDNKANKTEFDGKGLPDIKIASNESDSDEALLDERQASEKESPDMGMGSNETDFENARSDEIEPNDAERSHRGLRIHPDIIELREAESNTVTSDGQEARFTVYPEWEPKDQGPNRLTVPLTTWKPRTRTRIRMFHVFLPAQFILEFVS